MSEPESDAPYLDPERPVEERVADLLERMTAAEKIGQLTGFPLGAYKGDRDVEDVEELIEEYHVGSVAPAGWAGAYHEDPEDVARTTRRLQTFAREETRLGIPLLFTADAVHGHAYVRGTTTFPNGLGVAATWQPELAADTGRVTARELRATGIHQNYAPTCDVGRDPRWGRIYETYGESPELVGEFAAAEVEGLQGRFAYDDESVLATAKHFPAYGEPRRGDDAAPVEISESTLRRTFLPPFEAVIDAGVQSIMPSYNSIDAEPTHASRRYLRKLLREELDFDGHTVSDWGAIDQLHEDHHVTADARESCRVARIAGVDVFSAALEPHVEHTLDLVEDGELPESLIDESVRRVLRAKFELGLFETELPDPDAARDRLHTEGHRQTARETAAQSLTLLENDGLLPLDDPDEIFVGGPNADDLIAQLGGWSVWDPEDVPGSTIREGLASVTDATVTYEQGATIEEATDVEAAAAKAAEADVAVVAVGEDWYIHEFNRRQDPDSDNEAFPSRVELELPDAQRELVQAIHDTGTPTVGVLVTGRPIPVPWMAEHLDALLMAYYPGGEGGEVVAEALVGDVEPSGRLPVTIPRSASELPSYFNQLPHPTPIGEAEHLEAYDPLYEFGHGLGYADVDVTDLELSASTIGPGGTVDVTVTVENESDRAGSEVVQLFATDRVSTRVTPVRELAGFQRVDVDAGATETVTIELAAEDLGVVTDEPPARVEPGTFDLQVDELTAELDVESEYSQ